jgi:hypothetical protein
MIFVRIRHYTQMNSKVGFLLRRAAIEFQPACIAQLIQVELLQRRFPWLKFKAPPCQNPNF